MNWAAHRHMETIERTDIRWHIGLAIGALCVSASAVLLGLADTTPATATVARSALALPVVAALAFFERRHNGGLGSRKYLSAVVCGVLFAGDMLWWTQSIPEVGAGLSTVLVNIQVAIVPLLAYLVDRERSGPRFLWSLPVILVGVLLAGGIFEHAVGGTNPTWGTVHGRGRAVLLRLPVPVAPRRSGRPAVADVRRGAGVVDCRRGGRGVRVAQSGHLTRLADGRVADRGHRDRPVARMAACGVLHSAASQRCRVRPATAHPDRCRRPRIVDTRRAALGVAAGGLRAGAGRELRRDCPPLG